MLATECHSRAKILPTPGKKGGGTQASADFNDLQTKLGVRRTALPLGTGLGALFSPLIQDHYTQRFIKREDTAFIAVARGFFRSPATEAFNLLNFLQGDCQSAAQELPHG